MPAQPQRRGHTGLWILLTIAALGAGFAAGWVTVSLRGNPAAPSEAGGDSGPDGALDKVVALGRIEPKDDVLSVGVSVPDRIAQLKVQEGNHVEKGQLLAVLDSETLRELERKVAEAQLEEAKKRLQAITASGNAQIHVEEIRGEQIEEVEPLEIEAQKTKIDFLKAQEENAKRDYERYVAAGDTVADQDKEKQRLLRNQIHAELVAAECQYKKMSKGQELNRSLAKAQLESAKAELKRNQSAISLELLEQQIAQANERLKETQVRRPRAARSSASTFTKASWSAASPSCSWPTPRK